ncbi:MAG: Rib/alpha-like domain-containing protein [Pseudoclavibacter sp.]
MNISARRKGAIGVVAGAALAVTMMGVAGPASAAEPDAYLQDYTSDDGYIEGSLGNNSGLSGDMCGFVWSAQSVIDTDLPEYSVNGFLESVRPLDDATLPGSGWAQIQHWYSGDQLNWRIPIALDAPLASAQVTMVFDDPDWAPNVGSFEQYSEWPDRSSAFNRFMGDAVGLYTPHDDTLVTPFEWGEDAAGNTTLTFNLGNIEAGTSTVLAFTGTANDGAEGILSGTSYGAKLTLDGTQPMTTCLTPAYAEQTVLTGDTATVDPEALLAATGEQDAFPAGTNFALGEGAPEAATIDEETGRITWSVPGTQPVGSISMPVAVTYADESTDAVDAIVHVAKEAALGPFDDQQITLGEPIEDVTAELLDHLGQAFGDESTVVLEGLPDGVTFDDETGLIAGTPTEAGEFPVTVTGLDADGAELVSTTFTITVSPEATVVPPSETQVPDAAGKPGGSGDLAPTGSDSALTWGIGAAALTALVAGAGGLLLLRRRRQS